MINKAANFDEQVPFFLAIHSPDRGVIGHFHHFYELIYYTHTSGQVTMLIDDTTYSVETGDIVLVEPRRMHSYAHPPGSTCERLVISFNNLFLTSTVKDVPEIMNVLAEYKIRNKLLHFEGKLRERVVYILNTIIDEFDNADEDYENMCRLLLGELLLLLKRNAHRNAELSAPEDSPTMAAVLQIISYIMNHLNDELTLTSLADRFCFSRSYLTRIFRRHTGFTITEYIHNARIEKAVKLLRDQRMSVTDTAGEVGFNNISHFGRVFQKVMGTSPRKYRAVNKGSSSRR